VVHRGLGNYYQTTVLDRTGRGYKRGMEHGGNWNRRELSYGIYWEVA
jgi:hypothetical protein